MGLEFSFSVCSAVVKTICANVCNEKIREKTYKTNMIGETSVFGHVPYLYYSIIWSTMYRFV